MQDVAPTELLLDVDDGAEIRLFDPRRNPQNWTELIARTDCAVFLKDRTDSTALAPDGRPFAKLTDVTCVVFQSLDAAQQYCAAKVRDLPQLRCEIYDAEGLAHPLLLVILHPEFQQKEQTGSIWRRRRKLFMVVLILLSVPLFWIGARGSNASDVAIFFGINCLGSGIAVSLLGCRTEAQRTQAPGTCGIASQTGTRRCLS